MSCIPVEEITTPTPSSRALVPLVKVATVIKADESTLRRWIPKRLISAQLIAGDWHIDVTTLPIKYRARYMAHVAAHTDTTAPLALAGDAETPSRYALAPSNVRERATYRYEAACSLADARAKRLPHESLAEVEQRWLRKFQRRHSKKKPVSLRTVKAWVAMLEAAGGDINVLVDRNDGAKQRGSRIPAPARQMFRDQWLRAHQPNIALIHRNVTIEAERRGWGPLPTYLTFWRYATEHLPKLVRRLLRDNAANRRTVLPYVVRDPSTLPAYHTIQSDIRQLDVPVRCDNGCDLCSARKKPGKRKRGHFPFWIAFIDIRSRRLLGSMLTIDVPTSKEILQVYRGIVAENGLNVRVYLDNGSNYRKAFGKALKRHGLTEWNGPSENELQPRFATFGVVATYALPWNAQAKPIESMLRRYLLQFDQDFDTYRGALSEKNEFAREVHRNPQNLPTLSEMAHLLNLQIDDYNTTPHTGKGMDGRTPDDVFYDPALRLPRRDPDASFAYLFFDLINGGRVVGRLGVRDKGRHYRLQSLRKHLEYYGERVDVRVNPANPLESMVYDRRNGAFICRAVADANCASYTTKDELTNRLIRRVFSDDAELVRMANEYVEGAADRLREYRLGKIAYLEERLRQNAARRQEAEARLSDALGRSVTVIGPLSSAARNEEAAPNDEFTVEALLDILDADEEPVALERQPPAPNTADTSKRPTSPPEPTRHEGLCVAAPRSEQPATHRRQRRHPKLTPQAIAKQLGTTFGTLRRYMQGLLSWPPGLKDEYEALEALARTTPHDAVIVLPEPKQPKFRLAGDLTYAALARELGISRESVQRNKRSGKWPTDEMRERFEAHERRRAALLATETKNWR